MKLQSQNKRMKTLAAGSSQLVGPRVQRRVRGSAGNHLKARRNKLERQADTAAERIIRGEKNVARLLSPAPTASLRISASYGSPLPRQLRQQLEIEFGARLDAVRIHKDKAADSAAVVQNANAFAAGRDIYFRSGAYAPHTSQGRHLLLHEIAHVLQQTGRRDSDNQLRATDLRGSGDVQCETLEDFFKEKEIFIYSAAREDIIKLHKDANPADKEMKDHGDFLSGLIGKDKDDIVKAVKDKTSAADFTATPGRLALYFDFLKASDAYSAAINLVGEKIPAKTAYGYNAFYTKALKGDLAWLSKTMSGYDFLKKFWMKQFIDTYRVYFYGVARPIWNLSPQGDFETRFDEELAKAKDKTKLIDNERYFYALAALRKLDEFRKWELNSSEKFFKSRNPSATPLDYKLALTAALAEEGVMEEDATQWQMPPESSKLLEETAPKIRELAGEANEFWLSINEMEKARQEGKAFEGLGAASEIIAGVRKEKVFNRLESHLVSLASGIFLLAAGGAMLNPKIYLANMKAQQKRIEEISRIYDLSLIELQRKAAQGKPINSKLALQLGWVIGKLFGIYFKLGQYSVTADEAYMSAYPDKPKREDIRIAHRLDMADFIFDLAAALGYDKLRTTTLEVLTATQKGQKQSQIAITGELGDWEKTEADFEQMKKDFPTGEISGLEPLTGADLANFIYSQYFGLLAGHLRDLLKAQGKDYSGKQGPIINQALKLMESHEVAQRWVLKNYRAAVKPEDRFRFNVMLAAHPKHIEFRNAKLKAGHAWIVPSDYYLHRGGLVTWIVPAMDVLVGLLKEIGDLDDLVKERMVEREEEREKEAAKSKKGKKKTEAPAAFPEWIEWLRALLDLIRKDPELLKKVSRQIEKKYETTIAEVDKLAQQASSHWRRVVLLNKIKPMWEAYDAGDIRTFTKPNNALRMMTDFASRVSPPADITLQMAALTLELGPLMEKKLGPQTVLGVLETPATNRLDVIVGLLPHLEGALAMADNPTTKEKLLKLDLLLEGDFKKHRDAVELLKKQTEERALAVQKGSVLEGNAEANSLVSSSRGYPILAGPDHRFWIDGISYELVKVHKTFSYNPGMAMTAGGIQWPESKLGNSILKYGSGPNIEKKDRKGEPIIELIRNDAAITVLDTDDRLLSELAYAVAMRAIVRQLEDLGVAIEYFGEALKIGASFIPGVGPAIMVAELVTGILTFIASPEFDEIVGTLGGDPDKLIDKAIEGVSSWAKPELLWEWLLFGKKLFPALPALGDTPRQKRAMDKLKSSEGKVDPKGKLAKLLKRLKDVGKKVSGSVLRLRSRVQYPVRRTQVFVMSRPMVALVLRIVSDNLYRLTDIKLQDLSLGTVTDATTKDIAARMKELNEKIGELIVNLRHLELPAEIIPVEQLVDLTLDLVMNHLGGKYKVGVRALKEGLKLIKFGGSSLWDRITKAIADEFKAANLDPNLLWRDAVRKHLQPEVQAAGQKLADTIGGIWDQVPFLKKVGHPEAPQVAFDLAEEDFPESSEETLPETQMYRSARGPRPVTGSLPSVPGAGAPLDKKLRGDATRRFGHDFSHVRLHTGPEASRVTSAVGAEGLTTGSHIYLRPGLSPSSGSGAKVFRHELTHVLQQVGPRPLGEKHSSQPAAGRPGRGVRYDAQQEATAERVSDEVAREQAARPVDAGRASSEGAQPSLDDVIAKFFKEFGKAELLLGRVGEIESGKGGGKARLDSESKKIADELPEKLIDAIKALKEKTAKQHFANPFDTVNEEIVKYLIDNHAPAIRQAIKPIVKRTMQEKVVKKKDGDGKTESEWVFSISHFKTELEEYLFGKTGIFFDVDFNTKKVETDNKKSVEVVDLANPFQSIKVKAVHLPFIGGTAALWDMIIENTFVKNSPLTFLSRYKQMKPAEAKAEYKGEARILLGALGPHPRVFMSKEFRFTDATAKMIEEKVFPVAGGKLTASNLPPAAAYVKNEKVAATATEPGNWTATEGYVALRLGSYSQRKRPGEQFGVDRDAHHLTQFLLLEYLSNKKSSNQPFRHGLSLYPGVKGSGRLVKLIEKPKQKDTGIKVAEYEVGRGGLMPTILISKHTHIYGNVHVEGKADDGADETSSQGGRVHHEFKKALGGEYEAIMFDKKTDKLRTVEKQTKGEKVKPEDEVKIGDKPVTSEMLQERIYSAACKTYTWMKDDMMDRLKTGLETKEVEYYAKVAGLATHTKTGDQIRSEYKLEASQMADVIKEAKKHNKQIMETDAGFEEKT